MKVHCSTRSSESALLELQLLLGLGVRLGQCERRGVHSTLARLVALHLRGARVGRLGGAAGVGGGERGGALLQHALPDLTGELTHERHELLDRVDLLVERHLLTDVLVQFTLFIAFHALS